MRLLGAYLRHRPWQGPKTLHTMIAAKNEKRFCARGCFFPGTILRRIRQNWLSRAKIHLLHVGWRNFFSSCAVVSVFGSGGKQVLVLHTYVLRVQQSTIQLWCCVSFLVLAGNSFWCTVRTQCTIQLCGCVSFLVVAGNSSQNQNTFLQKNLIGLLYYDPLADVCIS